MDARTGKPIPSFGSEGTVDLHGGLGERARELFVSSNTPGVVFEDLLILGHRASESLRSAPGDIRAFDKRTGELLWEASLPAGGSATPATYSVDGRQYVVVAAGGGKMGTKSGDAYVAFAIRESARPPRPSRE